MLSNREVYNPEHHLDTARQIKHTDELKDGKNLDRKLLSVIGNLELEVDAFLYGWISPRRDLPDKNQKGFAPFVLLGLMTTEMYRDYVRFQTYGKQLRNPANYVPKTVTIDRYAVSPIKDNRMPGSLMAFDRQGMQSLMREAKKLTRAFASAGKKALRGKVKKKTLIKEIFGK